MNDRIYRFLGTHQVTQGVHFAVWAPNALSVSVIGDFNDWNDHAHRMIANDSGVWSCLVENAQKGQRYKFRVFFKDGSTYTDKSDPVGFYFETPPQKASIIWDLGFEWTDHEFVRSRAQFQKNDQAISIYEMHLGSWRKSLSYQELAQTLPSYLNRLGFTHVEFQPIMEHPFYGSWGYQTTGFFAPTSRYGTPQDFMALIDALHAANIGVILDWSCAHFPDDPHGLSFFDGTHLFENEDTNRRVHPDWGSLLFNYSRLEVCNFLISSALFWLEHFHIDGLRVDAVASMLYLDYSRKDGEWTPNALGGKENLEAVAFLIDLNASIKREHPDVLCIAEESTAWPKLTAPIDLGGLGFNMKWDMGWMHDTIEYFQRDPIYRRYHQDQLIFRSHYAFSEKFVLALSHDEVVHQKGSLLSKMPGAYEQKFANLRCLLAYQFALPGKKLLFMGTELAPWEEWNHEGELDFNRLVEAPHSGMNRLITDLNRLYRSLSCLHEMDSDENGFLWLDHSDHANSILSFARRSKNSSDFLICVFNLTPVVRHNYRIAALSPGRYEEILNTDSHFYGGSGFGNLGSASTYPIEHRGWPNSLCIVLPPLSGIFFRLDQSEL